MPETEDAEDMYRLRRSEYRVGTMTLLYTLPLFLFDSFILHFLGLLIPNFEKMPYWEYFRRAALLGLDVCILLTSIRGRRLIVSRFFVVFAVWFVSLVFPTLLFNRVYLMSSLYRAFVCLSFVLYLENMIRKTGMQTAIASLILFVEILNYVNLAVMIIFPNGLYHTVNYGTFEESVRNGPGFVRTSSTRVAWLLGHQTTTMRVILPSMAIAFLYRYYKKQETGHAVDRRSVLLLGACFFEIIIAWSASNYVILFCVILVWGAIRTHFRIRVWYFVPVVFAIYFFLVRSGGRLQVLQWFSEYLGRNVELVTRVIVWQRVLIGWLKHPILGCGYVLDGGKDFWRIFGGYPNPHSGYLWILYEGGIVASILFVVLVVAACRDMRKMIRRNGYIAAVYSSMIALLVAMLTDDYLLRSPFCIILFVLCYHLREAFDRPETLVSQ